MGLSIRWRLTLWITLALAGILVGFSALVYAMLSHALYERVDQSLLSVFQEIESKPDPDMRDWIKEAKEHQNILCVVYDPEGSVYERTGELSPQSVPAPPRQHRPEPSYADRTLPILGHQRTQQTTLNLKGRPFTVLLMAGLDDVDRELHQLLVVAAMAIPAALVGAGGLAYLLARKALAPMKRLHQLTEQITADHLDRRLPVANANDELGDLTRTINAMIGRLERSFAEVRRFTADASHELRTPLMAIRTEAEIALGGPALPAEHQHLLESILEECDRLSWLTHQLLTLSREDAGVARQIHERLDLAALVGGVVDTMRTVAEAKGLHLRIDGAGPVPIRGDGARLRQVLYNLLDNAIKYTPEGGAVEVRVGIEDRAAVVTVRDTGIGIPPEHLPRVFDRFYRVDKARSRAEGGTGLGLSIAKTIVVAHGGRIELTSTPGQGTLCAVKLPAAMNPEEKPDAKKAP